MAKNRPIAINLKITKARENHTSAALPFRPPASCRPKRASELAADGRRIPWSVCLTTKSGEIQEPKMRKLAANSTSNCILVLYHSRSVEFVGDSLDLNVRGIGVQSAAPAVNHVWSLILAYFGLGPRHSLQPQAENRAPTCPTVPGWPVSMPPTTSRVENSKRAVTIRRTSECQIFGKSQFASAIFRFKLVPTASKTKY